MSKMEVILAAGLVLSFVLHAVARRTKTTVDDKVADALDDGLDVLKSRK